MSMDSGDIKVEIRTDRITHTHAQTDTNYVLTVGQMTMDDRRTETLSDRLPEIITPPKFGDLE